MVCFGLNLQLHLPVDFPMEKLKRKLLWKWGDYMRGKNKHIHLVNSAAADVPRLAEETPKDESNCTKDICEWVDFGFSGGCSLEDHCKIDYT